MSEPVCVPGVTVTVLLDEQEARDRLHEDALNGLASTPKDLPPKWFYDERGSELFELITTLPEYYPTRAETEILEDRAGEIASVSRAEAMVELGSGSATKTRILLDALCRKETFAYAPFDVCEEVVRASGEAISLDYSGLSVHGVVGDFERHLMHIPRHGRQLLAFLGGTIGNLLPDQRRRFLRSVRSLLYPGDCLLLGADLVKDPARLLAAYDDAAGVTAEFNRNVLAVLNRELGADFEPSSFEHVAFWDPAEEWIEMRLRSTVEQDVEVKSLEARVHFDRHEEMRTEVSAKFRPQRLVAELAAAGLVVRRYWTDRAGDFSLTLAGVGA